MELRTLINIVEQFDVVKSSSGAMIESRGLGARKPGEEFVSTTNADDKIYIDSVEFYPDNSPSFSSPEETAKALQKLSKSFGNATINIVGDFKKNNLAFGVATFVTPDKRKIVFIKPFQRIKPDPTQNDWNNQTGIPGYKYNSKVAAKSQAGLMPQDILTNASNLAPKEIVNQIAEKFGLDSPLTQIAQMVAAGNEFPITIPAPKDISFSAFTNYFCELLHPISLLAGTAEGNAEEAATIFLGQNGFKKTLISFGTDKTEGLSDSIITSKTGATIKVSSKAAAGAAASAKNLLNLSREAKNVSGKKEQEVLKIIETVVTMGQRNAPLVLGNQFDIISDKDAADINAMYNQPLVNLDQVKRMKISPNLKNLIVNKSTDNPDRVNLYFHSIAAVAHKVADYINKNTDFSEVASSLLNNGALIQVYTKAKDTGSEWTIEKFTAQWPSKSVTGVKFSAGKTYYSTGIKGNFTFKILRGGAKDVPDETESDLAQTIQKAEIDTEPKTHSVEKLRPRRSKPSTVQTNIRTRR
jgi:hypothetical protein